MLQENEDEESSSPGGEQTPGPQRPRSNSGRELTDEVRALLLLLLFSEFNLTLSQLSAHSLHQPTNKSVLLRYLKTGNPGQCDD